MAKEKKIKKEKKAPKGARYSAWWGVLIFALLVFVDQITKAVADSCFTTSTHIPVIKGWIELTLSYNPGISFGWASDWPVWGKITLVAATGVVMLGLTIYYFCMDGRRRFLRTAVVFVVAGGVGNLIDRLYYKVWALDSSATTGVRDMVDLSRFGFAVCNFADFFITAGAIMFVLSLLFFDKNAIFPVGKYKRLSEEDKDAERAALADAVTGTPKQLEPRAED